MMFDLSLGLEFWFSFCSINLSWGIDYMHVCNIVALLDFLIETFPGVEIYLLVSIILDTLFLSVGLFFF